MKYLFIIISISVFYGITGLDESKQKVIVQTHIQTCPETDESDILRIHSFLTSSQLKEIRKKANIKDFDFNPDKLERQHTEAFINYWNKRNVEIVSTLSVCTSINDALISNKETYILLDDFTPIYYKVENLYVILYRKKTGHIEKGNNPVQILDEGFNIISNYKI